MNRPESINIVTNMMTNCFSVERDPRPSFSYRRPAQARGLGPD